jgi:hypothetical protein
LKEKNGTRWPKKEPKQNFNPAAKATIQHEQPWHDDAV